MEIQCIETGDYSGEKTTKSLILVACIDRMITDEVREIENDNSLNEHELCTAHLPGQSQNATKTWATQMKGSTPE